MKSDFWVKCAHYRNQFQPWINKKENWVQTYRCKLTEIVVNTNNGVEEIKGFQMSLFKQV